jgi:ABC-type transport system involved in multi-copper enzyme maturation permease subunit
VNGVVFIETLRRHFKNGVYIVFLVVVGAIGFISGALGAPPSFWIGLDLLAAVILGCQLIGPEFTSGTLQLVLSKPVNRSAYLLARYAAVVVAAWMFVALPFVLDSVARKFIGKENLVPAMLAHPVNVAVAFLLTCALLLLFGSLTRSYLNVAIYFLVETVLYVVGGALHQVDALRRFRGAAAAVKNILRNVYPSAPQTFDWKWTLMVATNAAVALLIACVVFARREVPYGAD